MARPAYNSGSDDMKILGVLLIAACWLNAGRLQGQEQWFKGNTHTHTLNSDGDSTPDDVVRWYRTHGYDFLFITDHGMVTNVDPLNALFSGGDQFLVLPGEEVTANRRSPPLAVHVNALGISHRIEARQAATARETLQENLNAINDAIQESGSDIAQINHPNFLWQLTADDIAAVKGATLMEIMNMHPLVNSFGAGPAAPSTEQMWEPFSSILADCRVSHGIAPALSFNRLGFLTLQQVAFNSIKIQSKRTPNRTPTLCLHSFHFSIKGFDPRPLGVTANWKRVLIGSRRNGWPFQRPETR